MTEEMKKFLDSIENDEIRSITELYLPVIARWAAKAGWDAVRKWLYAWKGQDSEWYIYILSKMDVEERRAEDKRRLAVVKKMGSENYMRIQKEKVFLQTIMETLLKHLISGLLLADKK